MPEGKRAVLYAPTYRDHVFDKRGRYRLDLQLDLERLRAAVGDDTVILFRKHHYIVDPVPTDPHGFVRDVSSYPDGTELLLAADVLVTDYSSMMFDFANTGRPMLFYTYDLDAYQTRSAASTFDFVETAAGAAPAHDRRAGRRSGRPRRGAGLLRLALRRVRREVLRARRRAGFGAGRGTPFRAVSLGERIGALTTRALRSAVVRYVRAKPRRKDKAGAEKRVYIILMTAFGMGGTIRTTLNLATYLASKGYEVVILSVLRARDEPFFGELPPGVSVKVLDDRRPEKLPTRMQPIRRFLRERPSMLMHPDDIGFRGFNLWVDWRLAKALRRRTGFLIATRPGLNLIATFLAPPGLVLIGQEHMHLREHAEPLQEAMQLQYRKLATLSVLTKRDAWRYGQHLEKAPRVVSIPNTVRDMGGARADLTAKTVLAAGRLVRQKGYDRLIRTWVRVAPEHPDWRLVIYGEGPKRAWLEGLISRFGLEDVVTLPGPAEDLGAEMAKASIFVLSSRWEGLPLALLEAMGVGMAVVSFDCPTGPADVIDDHRNGLLIRPRNDRRLRRGARGDDLGRGAAPPLLRRGDRAHARLLDGGHRPPLGGAPPGCVDPPGACEAALGPGCRLRSHFTSCLRATRA